MKFEHVAFEIPEHTFSYMKTDRQTDIVTAIPQTHLRALSITNQAYYNTLRYTNQAQQLRSSAPKC